MEPDIKCMPYNWTMIILLGWHFNCGNRALKTIKTFTAYLIFIVINISVYLVTYKIMSQLNFTHTSIKMI